MMRLSSLIATFEKPLLAQYSDQLLPGHKRALQAMLTCRTALSPRMQTQCNGCRRHHYVPHSCGHRACPHCQHHESQQWLERQLKRQVPGHYFMITFTLPAELRPLAWQHQRAVYDALMQCSWATLKQFSQNDKQLQGTPGAVAVLHTHSRRLAYHPHVHLVMPAAAINANKRQWHHKRHAATPYLFSQKALAKVFRAKLLDSLAKAKITPPSCLPAKWVVHCQAVGQGEKALVYLGRYLYRGVIQEKDILHCRNGRVTFRYKNSKTKRWETRTLPGADFLWLLLRHVLPKGFRRTRNFGFLHPNSKRLIYLVQLLLNVKLGNAGQWIKPRPQPTCPHCGGTLVIVQTRLPPAAWEPTANDTRAAH